MQNSISEVKWEIVHADGAPTPMVSTRFGAPQSATVHDLAVFIERASTAQCLQCSSA